MKYFNKKKKKKMSFLSRVKRRFTHVKKSLFFFFFDYEMTDTFSIYEVIIIILISILFGIVVGYIIVYSRNQVVSEMDSDLSEVVDTYTDILDNYYGTITSKDLADSAIKGMVAALKDPYSNYMNSDIAEDFNETLDGFYVGIGVEVMYDDDYNKIISVFDGSPALKAGLQVDDVLLKVDGKDVKNVLGDQLANLIRGKEGTEIVIEVRRGEIEKELVVVREKIEIQSVYGKIIHSDDKNVGYIKLNSFAANSYKQFREQLVNLERKKIDYLMHLFHNRK